MAGQVGNRGSRERRAAWTAIVHTGIQYILVGANADLESAAPTAITECGSRSIQRIVVHSSIRAANEKPVRQLPLYIY